MGDQWAWHNWTCSSRLADNSVLTLAQRRQWRSTIWSLLAVLIASPLALSCITLFTDWDLLLADMAFDFHAKTFPLRHAWVTEVLNHLILKRLFTAIALVWLLVVAWDLVWPRPWSWLWRLRLRIVALSAIAIPALISLIKHQSDAHCPWDLARYGGVEPYVRLFESLPPGTAAGHCMPAGHASSALWMISLAILFVPYRLRFAILALIFFLILGLGVGWMQQLRGAHFLTHTLWSLWIAMATLALIIVVVDRWPRKIASQPEA